MVMDFPGGAEDENVPANAGDAAYRRRFPVRGPEDSTRLEATTECTL